MCVVVLGVLIGFGVTVGWERWLGSGLAVGWGGGWKGWGREPSLTAAHSEAAPNPTPSTRQVRERRELENRNAETQKCRAKWCSQLHRYWPVQADRVPATSTTSVP